MPYSVTPLIEFVIFSTAPGSDKEKKLRILVKSSQADSDRSFPLPCTVLPHDKDIDTAATTYLSEELGLETSPVYIRCITDPELQTPSGRAIKFLYYALVTEDEVLSIGDYGSEHEWVEYSSLDCTSSKVSIMMKNSCESIARAHTAIADLKGIDFILSILELVPEYFTSRDAETTAVLFNREQGKGTFQFYRYLREVTSDPSVSTSITRHRFYPDNPNIVKLDKESIDEHKKQKRQGKRAVKYRKIK